MNKFSKLLQNKLLKMYPEIEFSLEDKYYGEGSFRTKTDSVYILYMFNALTKTYELRIEPIVSFNKWSQAIYQHEINNSNIDNVLNDLNFIVSNIKTISELSNRYFMYCIEDKCSLQDWYKEVTKEFVYVSCAKCGELIYIDVLENGLCLMCEELEY